jgi:hypothetical protein
MSDIKNHEKSEKPVEQIKPDAPPFKHVQPINNIKPYRRST